jgi:hypothetical protein
MRLKHLFYLVIPVFAATTGCASWQAPGPELATRVPVVKIGQAKPETDDYILLLTAGTNYPVRMNVDGSFLAKKGNAETTVQVQRDVYLYKHWTSFDGKMWQRGKFDMTVAIGLEAAGGKVEIKVDEKK